VNPIKSLMGRRQFLVAAGVTSTSALAYSKIANVINPVIQTGTAIASEKAGIAGTKGTINRYPHLLSPVKIGNVILKNRMTSNNAIPHSLLGPENYLSDGMRNYYVNIAKNGAAVVTCRLNNENIMPRKERGDTDSGHEAIYENDDYGVQNYLFQLSDSIHAYGARATVGMKIVLPSGFKKSEDSPGPGAEMPIGMLRAIIDDTVKRAIFFKNMGYDMVTLATSDISPFVKNRTDKYGGSLENRARFDIELCEAIKKACGQDFLIEHLITIEEPSIARPDWSLVPTKRVMAYSLEDVITLSKYWEGLIDIMQIRLSGGNANHPCAYNQEKNKPYTLRMAQAIKDSGVKIKVSPNGGFQDLDFNEECIATGKCDFIAMGHAFICDWDYGKKAYEGRGEDVVPCIMCDKCHGQSKFGVWSMCSVNPKLGVPSAVKYIETPPTSSKKVAVVGGGPAGMKAAITSAERGHKVTLFEKNDYLGGNLFHSDFAPCQYPVRDFKDYLIRQVKKTGIEVRLKTTATPDMIKSGGYDAVLAGLGSEVITPKIPGADSTKVWNITNIWGKEKELGKNIAFIGGGEFGTEAAIYLAQMGHKVTVLTSEKQIATATGPFNLVVMIDLAEHMDNLNIITEAITTRVSEGKAIYKDARGNEKSVPADSIVIYAGLKPRVDEAMKFYDSANEFITIGDCNDMGGLIPGGNIQKSIRNAFFAASQI
jgi:2,4-dienoyl-CoA reductase-like NADH-dependent reductase (Old Yellow Enzyme family)/thioredoxin reductase